MPAPLIGMIPPAAYAAQLGIGAMPPPGARREINLGQLQPVEQDQRASDALKRARQSALVDVLADGGLMSPTVSGSFLEAIPRGVQAFLETRAARDEAEAAEKAKQDRTRTLSEALEAYQGDSLPPGVEGPVRPGDPGRAAQILAGNPDTAETAWTLAIGEAQRRREAEAANAAHGRALELKAAPGWSAPVAGRDTPLSPEVMAQRRELAVAGRTPPRPNAVNVRLPNGTITPGRKTETGELEYLDESGAYRPAPFGASMAGVQLSGTEADADKKRLREFAEYEDAASNFMRTGDAIIGAIDNGTPVFGTSGGALRFANSVRSQAVGIARAFGNEEQTGEEEAADLLRRLQEGSETWDRLRSVVGDRTDILGLGISLAYMRAKLLDRTGRVSDEDLENSMKSLGFDTNDPMIMRRRIVQEMQMMNDHYMDRARRDQQEPERFTIPGRKQGRENRNIKDKYGLE